ncbi:glycosyltransferase [Cognatiyoonia sp.]|uniref:glycosyltransferase n=1 Tax=Cognatiyoonia sp. TaxID=2211652 RepID=UPI003F69FB10
MVQKNAGSRMESVGTAIRTRRLVAVVVSFNRLEKLKVTLSRLCESDAQTLAAIVVVDNASTDGTQAWLQGCDDPRLDVILSPKNTGGAGGFAQGLERALDAHDSDWLVVMDDDGRPQPGALETFHDLDPEAKGWDGLAAAVFFPDGEICEMNRPSRNPFWSKVVFFRTVIGLGGRDGFHIAPGHYEANEPTDIDITSFVGFFVSAQAARAVALPDPNLFIYGDDGIYTLGLSQRGYRLVFHPAIRFDHDCSTFESQDNRKFNRLWKVYYYHRNLLILYRMAAGWAFWIPLLIVVPKWVFRGWQHKGEARTYFRLLRQAVWDGLLNDRSKTHRDVLKVAEGNSD